MERTMPNLLRVPAGFLALVVAQLACLSASTVTTPSSAVATIVALTTTPGSSLPTLTMPPTITKTATPTTFFGEASSTPIEANVTQSPGSSLAPGTPLAFEGENLPETSGLITLANSPNLVEILRLGSGRNPRLELSGDRLMLGVISDTDTQLFDAITLAPLPATTDLLERLKKPQAGELRAARQSDGIYLEDVELDELRVLLEDATHLDISFSLDWSLAAGRLTEDAAGIWDAQNGNLIRRLDTGISDVAVCSKLRNVTISPDGSYAAAGCELNGNAYLWRIRDGLLVDTITTDARTLSGLAFSNQNSFLAAVLPANQIGIWRVRTGELVRFLDDAGGTPLMEGGSVLFSPDGYYVLGAFPSGEVLAWRVSDGGLLRRISRPGFKALQPSEGLATDTAADTLYWSDWTGLNTYELGNGTAGFRIPAPVPQADSGNSQENPGASPTGFLKSMAVSGDGRALTLIFDRVNPGVDAYRALDGTRLAEFSSPALPLMVRQSPLGNAAAVITTSGIYLLHPTRLAPIGFLEPGAEFERIDCAVFSPDGKFLATGRFDTGVTIWDWELKEKIVEIPGTPALSLAFSPGGTLLAVGTGSEVRLVDTTSWEVTNSVPADGIPVVFSQDGSLLAATNLLGEILIYSTETSVPMIHLVGHARPVTNLIFSPLGQWLASASEDGTVRIWGVPTQQ